MPAELIMIMLFVALIIGILDGKMKLKSEKILINKPKSFFSYLLGE